MLHKNKSKENKTKKIIQYFTLRKMQIFLSSDDDKFFFGCIRLKAEWVKGDDFNIE